MNNRAVTEDKRTFSLTPSESHNTIFESLLSLAQNNTDNDPRSLFHLTMAALAPIAYFGSSVSLSALAIQASPKDSVGLIGLSISLALLAFRRVTDITSVAEWSSLLGFFVLLWISHIVKLLALDKQILPSNWRMTYNALFDFRGIGTQKQYTNFSPDTPDINVTVLREKESRKATHPSKGSGTHIFLLTRLASAIIILLLDQAYTLTYSMVLQLTYADFDPSKQSYLRRIRTITVRETTIRSWLVFNFVWSSWAIFTATHDLLAFAFVALGIDEPEDWPSLYGSIFEAYSIRRFWGKYWHHLVQHSYCTYGSLISRKVLRLPRGSLADRTCVNFSVFLISGIVHACITAQLGFTCGYWEDIAFFMMCYAALLVEAGVQRFASLAFRGSRPDGWTCRLVGYTWVFGFLFWVLPKHQYPKVLCAPA